MPMRRLVTRLEFGECMNKVGLCRLKSKPIGVAVSGGADSIALALLTHEWMEDKTKLLTISVDHRLRKEGALEVQQVKEIMKYHGIHHISGMCSAPSEPLRPSQVQSYARTERYKVLQQLCQEHQVRHLLIGHHLDDQLETVLFRFARASGIVGLKGMSPTRVLSSTLTIHRPLLSIRKQKLKDTCQHRFNQAWIEDPSNKNQTFDRVRIRQALQLLEDRHGPEIIHQLDRFQQHMEEASAELLEREKEILKVYSVRDGKVIRLSLQVLDRCFDELLAGGKSKGLNFHLLTC